MLFLICIKQKMPVEYVFPLIRYKFEDAEFYGINKADKFLTDIYENFMLPPKNERRGGVNPLS